MRRRQLREGVYEERPAVILGDLVAVHDAFQNKYPECKVPFESFCRMLPWYMRMRETSLCHLCASVRLLVGRVLVYHSCPAAALPASF